MLVNKAVQLAVLAAAMLLESKTDAATSPSVRFCGRQLSEIMSRVCHAYNSPWDTPTVVEQPGSVVRRRRQAGNGIADECCNHGCTWEQFSEYCSVSANSESPLGDMETHIIADRSAEQTASESKDAASPAVAPAAVGSAGYAGRTAGGARGNARSRGYGRARARGRRCWCRRKRRSGRRRSSLMEVNRSDLRLLLFVALLLTLMTFRLSWTNTGVALGGPRKKCSTRCSRGGHRITANHVGPDTQH